MEGKMCSKGAKLSEKNLFGEDDDSKEENPGHPVQCSMLTPLRSSGARWAQLGASRLRAHRYGQNQRWPINSGKGIQSTDKAIFSEINLGD